MAWDAEPHPTSRRRVYEVLEVANYGDRLSRFVDRGLVVLVALNVVAAVTQTVDSIYRAHPDAFDLFEWVSVSVFAVEYFLRLWVAPERASSPSRAWRERLRWLVSPMALADFVAILPIFLAPFVGSDLRVLRVLRLVRVLKLTRYYGSLTLILDVIRAQRRAYGAALSLLGVLLVLAASGIYVVEQEAQPEAFGSIPAAMWWALVTLTTVGYGDVTPVTNGGKLFAACVVLVGVGVVALPAAILASGFLDTFQRNRQTLRQGADRAMADGVVTPEESEALNVLAERLGIVPETAREIMLGAYQQALDSDACPHCGKDLGPG